MQAVATIAIALGVALAPYAADEHSSGTRLVQAQAAALRAHADDARALYRVALAPTPFHRLRAFQLHEEVAALARALQRAPTDAVLEPRRQQLARLADRLAAALHRPLAPWPTLAAYTARAAELDALIEEVDDLEDGLDASPPAGTPAAERPRSALPVAHPRAHAAPPTPPPDGTRGEVEGGRRDAA
jgi:hypothetical protein